MEIDKRFIAKPKIISKAINKDTTTKKAFYQG
jgi:hypothetical protein